MGFCGVFLVNMSVAPVSQGSHKDTVATSTTGGSSRSCSAVVQPLATRRRAASSTQQQLRAGGSATQDWEAARSGLQISEGEQNLPLTPPTPSEGSTGNERSIFISTFSEDFIFSYYHNR